MHTEINLLLIAAVTIACLHTVTGPDHYLPFIALSRIKKWSFLQTLGWTVLCGCGHVASSVLLGLGGAALGWSLSRITWLESVRGGMAGWALLVFGLLYGIWGMIRAGQHKAHKHFDMEGDGGVYVYEHRHGQAVHPQQRHALTPWVMFIIFVLGPCEPMIPLLYFPAANNAWWVMALLIGVYTFFTLLTMTTMVILGYYGSALLQTQKLEPYVHALGGFTIFVCGAGMVWMGW